MGSLGPGPGQPNAAQPGLNAQLLDHPFSLVNKSGLQSQLSDRRPSRMNPDAKNELHLLYISDIGTNDVYVYSYPRGKLMGALTGFESPEGECVNKAGDVWITNTSAAEIVEYAHGGASPIATLSDAGQYPVGCSVNKSTGDLAVSNSQTTSSGAGSVSVYPAASGTPKTYSVPNTYYPYFLGYDSHGDLFVDGENSGFTAFEFARLSKGGKT